MENHFSSIENIFLNRTLGHMGGMRTSAVLLPLFENDGEIHLLITQRALDLDKQPGDYCFPGGHTEGNESPEETAVRETFEETGIEEKDIHILGRLDTIVASSGLAIIPVAAIINADALNHLNLNKDEVERVITVPLKFFIDTVPEKYTINMKHQFPDDFPFHKIYGGVNYQWSKPKMTEYFYEYKDHVIWGLTAKMIKNFCDIIKNE